MKLCSFDSNRCRGDRALGRGTADVHRDHSRVGAAGAPAVHRRHGRRRGSLLRRTVVRELGADEIDQQLRVDVAPNGSVRSARRSDYRPRDARVQRDRNRWNLCER